MNRIRLLGMTLFLPAIAACHTSHVAYVHNSVLGVDITASAEGTGRFVLGYDRDTYALVPRFTPTDSEQADAMSLTSISRVRVHLDDVLFRHVFATGTPAVRIAKTSKNLAMVREQVMGGDDKGAESEYNR